MTAPNFGNIQTPQFIPAPQRQNQLAEFGQLFATIVQNREQLAQQRERMAMERERLDADLEMDKIDKKKKLAEMDQQERLIGARNIVVTEALPALASMPGGITPEAVEQERMRLIKAYGKDFGTHISTALNEGVAGLENVRAGIAQRQSAVANAKVDEATVKADIDKALNDAERSGVELRTARIQEAVANMERIYPPARMSQFKGYLESGVSASDAARLSMVRLPPGVPADFKLPLAAGAAGGTDAKKAEALGSQARMGLDLIESAGSLPLSLPADLFRSTQGKSGVVGVLTKHLVNPRISPEEQMALQGYLLIGQAYTIHVTGATATDQQNQLFANTIIPLASDDPATQQQKRVVLKLLPELIARNLKPAEIAARMAAEGKRVGMNPARIKLLEAQIPLAQRYQNSPEYKHGVAREPAAPRDATAGFDPAVAGRFRPAP